MQEDSEGDEKDGGRADFETLCLVATTAVIIFYFERSPSPHWNWLIFAIFIIVIPGLALAIGSQRQGQDKLFVIVRRPGRLTDIESPLFEIFFYGSALAVIVTILISPLL